MSKNALNMTANYAVLHDTKIVGRLDAQIISLNCGGWHTRLTASGMNKWIDRYIPEYSIRIKSSNGMLYAYVITIEGKQERYSLYNPKLIDLEQIERNNT